MILLGYNLQKNCNKTCPINITKGLNILVTQSLHTIRDHNERGGRLFC